MAANLTAVRSRIATAGDPARVRVVAVTKGLAPEVVAAARAAGLDDLAENYAAELLAKHDGRGRWHLTGPVQRRTVRSLSGVVDVWQAVDRVEEGAAIARHTPGATVFAQVNVSGEDHKAGCAPGETAALVAALRALDLDVAGLMAVGASGGAEAARPGFARLRRLADDLGLRERSMGMSGDVEVAVEEGATMVRVGRALFGPRPTPPDLRR